MHKARVPYKHTSGSDIGVERQCKLTTTQHTIHHTSDMSFKSIPCLSCSLLCAVCRCIQHKGRGELDIFISAGSVVPFRSYSAQTQCKHLYGRVPLRRAESCEFFQYFAPHIKRRDAARRRRLFTHLYVGLGAEGSTFCERAFARSAIIALRFCVLCFMNRAARRGSIIKPRVVYLRTRALARLC